jgi:surfeit locus 1 family protein
MLPNGAAPTVPDTPQREWFYLNIDAIQPQMPYQLLPVFVLMLPEAGRTFDALPIRDEPLVLTEGNHFSYAIQWFTFALILGVGYIFLVRYWEMRRARLAREPELAALDLSTTGPIENGQTEIEPVKSEPNASEPAPPTLETSR